MDKIKYFEEYLTDIFNYSKFKKTPINGLVVEVYSQKIIFFKI